MRLCVACASYLAIIVVAVWMLGDEARRLIFLAGCLILGLCGPFLGAGLVWYIIRQVNRRTEPRPVEPGR